MVAVVDPGVRRLPAALAALVGLVLAFGLAGAALPAQPATNAGREAAGKLEGGEKAPDAPAYAVEGFRSARFGMTEEAVRKAIVADFKLPDSAIVKENNPTERTTILMINVPNILAGAGTAQISYILGYTHKQLIHVNLIWTAPKPKENEPNDFMGAAMALRNYFLSFGFRPEGFLHDARLPDGSLALIQGADHKGRLVSLVVAELAGQDAGAKKPAEAQQIIRLSYVENPKTPDVYRIKPGSF